MFGLEMLDVVIGLIFIYLLLALACTAAAEAIAGLFDRRAKNLEKGLLNLLGERERVEKFFEHPLIKALREDGTRPSYIPAGTFAVTLVDMLAPATEGGVSSKDGLRHRLERVLPEGSDLNRSLQIMLNNAADLTELKLQIETWFNNAMDRISAWYKQKTQRMVLLISFAITILANADSIDLAQQLYTQPAVREAVVTEARRVNDEQQSVVPHPGEAMPAPVANADAAQNSYGVGKTVERLQELGLKLGWEKEDASEINWLSKFIGLLLTGLAVSLGAPFWFDILNRIISVRGVGKSPKEQVKPAAVG